MKKSANQNTLVILIAFEESDNLGTGYLSAVLSEAGFETRVIDFRYNNDEILNLVEKMDPLVVGFSIIFQYYITQFQELIHFLRKNGIRCHFTAGGHYPSLRYEELFKLAPELDSIIRFDGEYTLLELVKCIFSGKDWRKIKSIVYRKKEKMIVNPARPLEENLDRIPFPMRSPLKDYAFGKKFATIIAGRGCIYNCSYCSSNQYYKRVPGPVKRLRNPGIVVREMELLFKQKECSVFLFQDDDFPVKTVREADWIKRFCNELKRKKLYDKIMWKISCRPDEIDEESFSMMKDYGLFLVFIGIEDGTDEGLKRLNKHMTVAKCLEGIAILKKIGIEFDFGFMLFQPSSTYKSIKYNLDFLKQITKDGITTLIFTKLQPYFETQIEKELKQEGRLKGNIGLMSYDYQDKSLNHYYDFIDNCFGEWLQGAEGIVNILKWARNYFSVYTKYFGNSSQVNLLRHKVRKITSESNLFAYKTMEEMIKFFESEKSSSEKKEVIRNVKITIDSRQEGFKKKIRDIVTELYYMSPECMHL